MNDSFRNCELEGVSNKVDDYETRSLEAILLERLNRAEVENRKLRSALAGKSETQMSAETLAGKLVEMLLGECTEVTVTFRKGG